MTNGGRSEGSKIAVYLGIGSNIGDREANLREAIARIKALGLEVTSESSIYETEPVGPKDQPWFLNQVIETRLSVGPAAENKPIIPDRETIATQAEALLSALLKIEIEMGRERTIASGPRLIDIDLLLFGDLIADNMKDNKDRSSIKLRGVIVPHPRMHLRRFVLDPLCEIAPDVVHPVLKRTCRELLASLDDASTVTLSRKRRRPSFAPRT